MGYGLWWAGATLPPPYRCNQTKWLHSLYLVCRRKGNIRKIIKYLINKRKSDRQEGRFVVANGRYICKAFTNQILTKSLKIWLISLNPVVLHCLLFFSLALLIPKAFHPSDNRIIQIFVLLIPCLLGRLY